MKKALLLISTLLFVVVLSACGGGNEGGSGEKSIDTITLADAGWDSIRFHNSVAQTIIENGYGYDTEVKPGSTAATIQGLREGDVNVYMEVWTDNIKEVYEEATAAGDFEKVSTNFDDNTQGLYVPTYVIEGDEERGIDPLAPDLKTVEDLKKYPELFEDPEDPGRGRILNAPSGWAVAETIDQKFETYGLDETMNNFMPGSDAAIVTSLADAYNSGDAWVGYYWSPTAVTAMYDLTLLEEPEYDEDTWKETKGTEFPPNDVVVAVHKDFKEQAPEVYDFLSNYETSSALTEQALTYMSENDASADEAAKWWMQQNEDVWTEWVPEDVASKVKDALK
ncbi:ABC transporter substrate-binding protein [Aquibacillus sp. 3ASR75-11]|uniref:ABC transporter substrate-binding protein n=2 Tax=Terrihalobacillus insolitus TaxID=2950438 RepID=A0A9X3WSI4_9BACI|nr:ABC transporter substrate-binding protein [Terrihalobacillus insolitus]MDC3413608.1 ABC transporter substrate-binding protein [Terrihalobacillus insolitus]MDC3424635.1 ABC transporter substrate-binding protein [Terrihalobacillus insolitus]